MFLFFCWIFVDVFSFEGDRVFWGVRGRFGFFCCFSIFFNLVVLEEFRLG